MADATAPRRRPPEIDWASRAAAVAALVLAVFALIFVFATSLGGGDEAPVPAANQGAKAGGAKDGAVNPKTYAVEEGDTLSQVADKFGVSVKRLQRLNPDIDPQILATGQELTIR